MNKRDEALKEYRRKLDAGEIEKSVQMNPNEKAASKPKSLRLAINAKCWDCAGESRTEVTRCHIKTCSLWAIRPWQGKGEAGQ